MSKSPACHPADAHPPGPGRWQVPCAVLVLVALVAIVFRPVASFEFIDLDEHRQVVDNQYIRGLTTGNVSHILTSKCVTSYYPVRTLTFALDYQLFGLDAGAFKRTNAAIHAANVLLVFWLAFRLLKHAASGENLYPSWDVPIAAVCAAVFAVHPIVVEPVAWILGREELLMATAALLCLHAWLSGRLATPAGWRPGMMRKS